jgi:hypothetical protein
MNLETDDWMTTSEAAKMLGLTASRVSQMANTGLLEVAHPWPGIRVIARQSVVEQAQRRTKDIRLSRGSAMRWIAARHSVVGHPVRRDRITADIKGVIASLDPTALRSELSEFMTEARPDWTEARRTFWAENLVLGVHHS